MPGTIAIGRIHAYQSLARIHACTQWDAVQCRHKSLNMNRQDVDTESFQDIVSLLLLRFHFSKSCSTHCQYEGWVANEFPRRGFVLFSSYLFVWKPVSGLQCCIYAYGVLGMSVIVPARSCKSSCRQLSSRLPTIRRPRVIGREFATKVMQDTALQKKCIWMDTKWLSGWNGRRRLDILKYIEIICKYF